MAAGSGSTDAPMNKKIPSMLQMIINCCEYGQAVKTGEHYTLVK